MATLNIKEAQTQHAASTPKRVKKKYKAETVKFAFSRWFVNDGAEDDGGNIRAFCPVCEDPNTSSSPSASFNPEAGIWNCQKGNHGGSIHSLAADLKHEHGWDIRSAAMEARHQDEEYREATLRRLNPSAEGRSQNARDLPTADNLMALTERLLANKTALNALMSARGFTRQTIIDWNIGFDGDRYTIPVRNAQGDVINVRRYKLNAARAQDKMLNLPGHGSAAIFGLSILRKHDTVVITEGETDCILLNQYGIPAVTHTAGAATFRPQWGSLFENKTVYVCYDNDKAGDDGARKAKKILDMYTDHVFIIQIPLETKGADITDYLHKEGFSAADFAQLMNDAGMVEEAKEFRPIPVSGRKASLVESMSEDLQNEVLELTVSIAGKQQEPYTAPKTIIASCDMSKGAACTTCPVSAKNGEKTVELRSDDESLFRFVDANEERRRKLMKEIVGARCSDRVEFYAPEDYHIEELLVQPSIDDRRDNESQTPQKRTVFSVSTHKSSVNEKRRMVGKNTPDPKNGKLKFMAWGSTPMELDIDKFELTPEDVDELKSLFNPARGQTAFEKCMEIANDLAQNVTHIYGRDILHMAYDMVWHSVLTFKVNDMLVEKGWLEMMVVGDTRTGKSEIAKELISHYSSGEMVSCEGMSFPGIVGGVQQIDNRWHMTWGVVPMNDRRLVVLDEVSGLKEKNVIEQMSSIRSSGIAQITKIQAEQTSARTRLIWIGNPADGSMLAESSDLGISALRSLVPNNEDIARFDFVAAAQKGEVADDVINSGFSEERAPTYTAEMSEKLIKWVWSLGRSNVHVTKEAAEAVIEAAQDLGQRYIADPPLIQSENVRFKVLRVAAAIAARTFSIGNSGKLVVKSCHIRDAVTFLDKLYETEAIGYARRSRRQIAAHEKAADRKQVCKAYLLSRREDVLYGLQMVGGNIFRRGDLKSCGVADDEVNLVVQRLLEWRMVRNASRGDIKMSPELIQLLREIEDEDEQA